MAMITTECWHGIAGRHRCFPARICLFTVRTRPRSADRSLQKHRCCRNASRLLCFATADESDVLPEELRRKRQIRQAGLAFSATMLTGGTLAAFAAGMRPPNQLLTATAAVAAALPATLATAKAVLGDDLHLEWHDNRLYWEYAVVNRSLPDAREQVEVKPTTDGRGNGAFAVAVIPKGSHLGVYEGNLLSEARYWKRYPSGVSDYCMRIDAEWTVDGAQRAKDTAVFSPCHMNHASSPAANVARHTYRKEQLVRFYAHRDIQAGEELLLDYGKTYWSGREHLIIS